MLLSMTGFGRSHKVFGEFSITVEVKSVNHRFHECYVRMPRQLVKLEDKLKRLVQSYIKRGKVDLFVTIEGSPLVKQKVEVNLELAKEYRNAYQKLSSELGLQHTIDLSHFLIKEDIIMISEMEENTEIIEEAIVGTTTEALKALLVMRENEGFGLRTEFERYLTDIEQILPSIAAVVPEVLQTYTDRLKRKF
ncbi:YicC/YloC family endoribonuclease [Bacillus coahuilensis]|uniref:YicC/YloC family endoribonuclease n=1 Tax=Bacillus coahuilensis TaxID=408580 RepID=UPI0001850C7B|nr:YicC/YloC family endoribonuclease [Bacillus coahuilensis]